MSEVLKLKKSGSALLLALFAIVVLSLMGTGLLRLGLQSRIVAVRTTDEIEARCAADAGLTKALYEMNQKLEVKPWSDSVLPEAADLALPNCDATFGYTVTGSVGGGYGIECTGRFNWAQRVVRCTLPLRGPFDAAIFAKDKISLKEGTLVDWYNYDDDDRNLQVGTNSTGSDSIDLKSGVTVNGDVVVGVNGDTDDVIKMHSGATVTGDIRTLTEEVPLSPVTVPAWLGSMSSGGEIKDSTTLTTSGKYSKIDLGNNETLTIDGPVKIYVAGKVDLGNSAEIQIVDTNPNASLTLYLGGDFEGKNGSNVNNKTQVPGKLRMYGLDNCDEMSFKNSSEFYGVIYAPDSDVIFYNSAEAYGAVVADEFEQKNSATFHYDASLRDVTVNDDFVRFVVKNWKDE